MVVHDLIMTYIGPCCLSMLLIFPHCHWLSSTLPYCVSSWGKKKSLSLGVPWIQKQRKTKRGEKAIKYYVCIQCVCEISFRRSRVLYSQTSLIGPLCDPLPNLTSSYACQLNFSLNFILGQEFKGLLLGSKSQQKCFNIC